MESKKEQAFVGLFVIIAVAILVSTVVALSGAFATSTTHYKTYLPFAGGLEQGFGVRYAGGPKVGRVEQIRIDPQNPTRMEVVFSVQPDVPVKTDSHVRIMALSPLGDNHLEIIPGSQSSPRAQPGATLPADPYTDFSSLANSLNELTPQAKQLLATVNDRATELKVTLARVNDLLNDANRANLSATIATTRGMLEEDRPKLKSALTHVDNLTAKMEPLIDDFKKTAAKADHLIDQLDGTIAENRPDIHKVLEQLRGTLDSANELVGRLNNTLDANSENIDELLENMRDVTENLKEFTDNIKARPYSLIRITNPRDHKPGSPQ
ncbi:MAG: MlaD family protein [Candidatus Acidiferrum sp.]|jgi:phospholipid/cholesterol/gamma-HCH transport system substrate-binding protein